MGVIQLPQDVFSSIFFCFLFLQLLPSRYGVTQFCLFSFFINITTRTQIT